MAGRPRSTFARVAVSLALLLYAALVLGSGLDRLTEQAPSLERLVPAPFRAEAERAAARQAVARDRRPAFLAHARAAVARDPVEPGSTSLLGGALLLTGDNAGAERAFRVAARFGWRDIPTQAYWYEAALEAGEMEPAVDRLDAILRTEPNLPTADLLFNRLDATAAGRAALERRLAQRPPWLSTYLQVAGKPDALIDRRSAVLLELAKRGAKLGCDTANTFATSALASGARRQAEQAWLAHCPGARLSAGLADPGFSEMASDRASPFGWQVVPAGDVSLEAVAGPAGPRLRLANSASVSRLVLTQPVALEPGRYRLTARTTPGRVAGSLGCNATPPLPGRDGGDVATSGQVIEVPACARQTFGIWLRPGPDTVELGPLTLARIG